MNTKLLVVCEVATAVGLWWCSQLSAQTLPSSYWPPSPTQAEQPRVLDSATSVEHIRQARQKFRAGALPEAQELLASKAGRVRTDVPLDAREIHVAEALMSLFAGDFPQALRHAEQAQSPAVPACPVCASQAAETRHAAADDVDIDAALVKAVLFAETKMEGLTKAWAGWAKQADAQVPLAAYLLQALEKRQLKYGHLALDGEAPGSHVDFFFERNSNAAIPVQMIFTQSGKYAGTMSLVRYRRAADVPSEYRLVFGDMQSPPLTVREFGRRGPSLPILQALARHRFYSLDQAAPSSLRAELEAYTAHQLELAPLASIWLSKTRSPLVESIRRHLADQELADWELTCTKNVGEIVHPTDGTMKVYWIVGFRNESVGLDDLQRLESGESSPELFHFAIFGHEPRGYVASYIVKAVGQEPGVWSYCLVRKAGGGIRYERFYDRPLDTAVSAEAHPDEEERYLRFELHEQSLADIERLIAEELADLK